jgi:hypothetical protein
MEFDWLFFVVLLVRVCNLLVLVNHFFSHLVSMDVEDVLEEDNSHSSNSKFVIINEAIDIFSKSFVVNIKTHSGRDHPS